MSSPQIKAVCQVAEYGTVSTIEGRRAAAPSRERRAALEAQRARLVSSDSKVGKSRYGR
ncbi:MAG: hypothetical protein ACYCTH_08510 [Cellulomonas sp.]